MKRAPVPRNGFLVKEIESLSGIIPTRHLNSGINSKLIFLKAITFVYTLFCTGTKSISGPILNGKISQLLIYILQKKAKGTGALVVRHVLGKSIQTLLQLKKSSKN